MRITKRWVLGGMALWLVLCFLLVAQFFYFASHPLAPGEAKNLVETPGPTGALIVDVYNLYGDATSADITQVIIRRQNEPFDWRKGRCIFSIEGLKKIKVKWVSDSKLQIQYERGTIYRSIPERDGIAISYVEWQ